MKRSPLLLLAAMVLFAAGASYGQNITGSDHDFSASGWSGGEICKVCHTPHNADQSVEPLWNHELTTATFTLYSSTTLDAAMGQPDGSSKLCLSCHDGSVAYDSFGGGTGSNFVNGTELLGTDLSDDHPVSFVYDATLATNDGGLHDPTTTNSGLGGTIDGDMLVGGKVQCATCHNPHDNANTNFLVKSNATSALCLTCHNK